MEQILFSGITPEQFLAQIVDAVKKEIYEQVNQPQVEELNDEFLTASEACEFLKCSSTKLWRLRRDKLIKSHKAGRSILIKRENLINYLEQREEAICA